VITAETLISALTVVIAGAVGWVGLIIPHIARMLVGPEIGINPFAGSVKKESGPEVVRKLSTKAFNDTLQYKTIQSVFCLAR
jgi:hypothetical protein